jgi:protein-glutamine gamma-glutamyltransferase
VSPLVLHRLFITGMAVAALLAFMAGAGSEVRSAWVALPFLVWAGLRRPAEPVPRRLEFAFRGIALVLAGRAAWAATRGPGDAVLPMIDLLLFLLCGEAWRKRESTSDARLYSLSLTLLVAAAAYRPGPGFAFSLLAFVVLATVALTVGHIQRQAIHHGVPLPRLRTPFLAQLAGLSGVVLLGGLLVFIAFPRHARGWAGRSPAPARVVVGFSDEVGLGAHGARIEADPTVVLRVEFPDGPPTTSTRLYWRGRSYDRFDGRRWSRSDLPPAPQRVVGGPPDQHVVQRIRALPLNVPVVFGLSQPLQARSRSRITIYRDSHGDLGYLGRGATPSYEIVSQPAEPPADSLRRLPAALPPAGAYYLQLPRIPVRLRALADSIAGDADNPYDKASAIEGWLRSEFRYTLDLPATAAEATLEHFLLVRRAGHCEYFSTAMTVLLRAIGIPARNVNGFLGGDWNTFGDYLAVTQNQAHSWVEMWLPGAGWITFDPTPPGEAAGAGAPPPRFPALYRVLDGLRFRWSVWVLDYGIEDQFALLDRAIGVWTPASPASPPPLNGRRLVLLLLATLAAASAVGFLTQRRRIGRAGSAEQAAYHRLRAAYVRAGYGADPAAGPLAFADALAAARAPGLVAAREAIDLYLAARYGPPALTPPPRAVHRAVTRALRTLREDRAGR